jgi:hypothetical protein
MPDAGSQQSRPSHALGLRRVFSLAFPLDDRRGDEAMTTSPRTDHHVDAVRRYLTVGFWLLAAGASAVLGLDLEVDARP